VAALPAVRAEINYVRNAPDSPHGVPEFVTADETQSTMQVLPGREVSISDAREMATDLDDAGFLLVPHASAVEDFGLIEEDPDVDALYYEEMTALLKSVTGASVVVGLGNGKKRFGETEAGRQEQLRNALPARFAHADNTDTSSQGLAELIAQFVPEIDLTDARWALYNMWRAVTPPPQDIPLAVCDARTVEPDDEVLIRSVSTERIGVITHDTTGFRFNPRHRWYYFSEMTRDEVLIFKAHDTDPRQSHRVPHSAFTGPACPPGTPTRASVEFRGFALF
jgi:hypothetical protein